MKKKAGKCTSHVFHYLTLFIAFIITIPNVSSQTDVDHIGRGLVAVTDGSSGIYVGWRLLGDEPDTIGFNLYRITDGSAAVKVNDTLLTGATNYLDADAVLTSDNSYYVTTVENDIETGTSDTIGTWDQNYLDIPLDKPANDTTPDNEEYSYSPNDASVADLDGDGEYEIIIKWYPSNAQDNSQSGYTGNMILDAYEFDGTRLWRIDFGVNIRSGAHYGPFIVYDLDGDGKAEVVARTAPGSKDATGSYLSDGPAADATHTKDYRNSGGYILTGPEYLTVFNGEDGTEIETIDLEPDRGKASDWGDSYGNRVDRFLGAALYLDGVNPSIVWCRGIYTKIEIAAYDFAAGELTQKWIFKSQDGYDDWYGMGSHNLSVGDVDSDGKDEIVYGHCAIDDDGTGLWSLSDEIGTSTGDAMHLADMIPERPGLERWACGEYSLSGTQLVDAATGEILWKTPAGDVGRAAAGDLSPDFFGMEVWGGTDGLRSATNNYAGTAPSSTNHVVWWDADLGRELLDGITIEKYTTETTLLTASGCSSNNGTKANPSLQADIFGDWREEVIWRTDDDNNLRIYTTTDVTKHRIKTLMHDRQYRLSVAWQNNSYNQPPHTSFYLGYDMFTPREEIPPSSPVDFTASYVKDYTELSWSANIEGDIEGYYIYKSVNEGAFSLLYDTLTSNTTVADSAISVETLYKYYIVAVDSDSNISDTSEIKQIYTTVLELYPPEGLTKRMGDTKNLVYWSAIIYDDTTYAVQDGLELKHSYTFEDGTANDIIGTADGTITGGSINNGAYTASSDGQYIELPAATIAINTYSAITIEAFIKATVDNDDVNMMAYFGGSVNNYGANGFFVTPDRNSESRLAISCGNTSQPWTDEQGITGDPVTVSEKHHVVSVLTDTSITLYINGEFIGTAEVSGNNSIDNLSNDYAWLCKGGYTSDPTWLGTIYEFNIYEGAMTFPTVIGRNYHYEKLNVGYNVYFSENESTDYSKINTDNITDTTFTHTDLTNGTKYNYKVSSVIKSGNESDLSDSVVVTPGDSIVVQAEDGSYQNAWVSDEYSGYTGSGYIAFDASGYADLLYVFSPESGLYELFVKYAQGNSTGAYQVIVNDSSYTCSMEPTTGWTDYAYDTLEAKLNEGFDNTIKITALDDNSGIIDAIIVGSRLDASGFNNNELMNSITAYPNPFNSVITIEFESELNMSYSLRITNMLGQAVEVVPINQIDGSKMIYQWDASGLESGIYFVTVYEGNIPYKTIKLMLKK